jgi:ATP dependent DNA ligase domain/ATP dependent DNA ligase C terminal region
VRSGIGCFSAGWPRLLAFDHCVILRSGVCRALPADTNAADASPSAVPSRWLGLRREGGRLADTRLQRRRPRPADLPQRSRSHAFFDEQLVSRFQLLGEPDPAVLCTPPIFIAFDVLEADRQDVRPLRLDRRRQLLEDTVDGSQLVLPVRRLESHGARAWATVERRGLEGFVAKDPASVYRPGATRSWIKAKLRHERVFVVGGIRNVDAFDGVLVGERVGDELRYRGVVEWGFKARDVLRLMRDARIFGESTSPFADLRTMRNAVWMEPRLLAEVSYSEIIGGRLRAPSWRGLVRHNAAWTRLSGRF